jgi:GTP cyclohydrolase I
MIDKSRVRNATLGLLAAIGEDPSREGLKGTPDRVAAFWSEFIDNDPGNLETSFSSAESGQLVVVSGIRVWSLCEHHLLPFWCDVAIGYIPAETILGLSKFARVAQRAAHKLQVQERLTAEIADSVEALTGVGNVAVISKGEHLCMQMRGIKSPASMSCSVMRGAFMEILALRSEFLSLVGYGRTA